MELHPILECGTTPQAGLWYVLSMSCESSSAGSQVTAPSMRVGHTMTQVGNKLYVIGGANPSGAFQETYVLDLETFTWALLDGCSRGFRAVYEHTAFVDTSDHTKIYVFGGADQNQNYNTVSQLDTTTNKWSTVSVTGTPPSPRTYHNGACVDNCLIVYSGGHTGTDPVGDRQTYSFDISARQWSILGQLRGDTPKPRLGHAMVAVGNKLYLHGGMAGSTFYDDLHVLDLNRGLWSSIKQPTKGRPSARAGHCGFVNGNNFCIFGGMNKDGALNDIYCFDTVAMKWSKIPLDGPPPAPRLDFAVCNVRLTINQSQACSQTADQLLLQSQKAKEVLEERLRIDSAGSNRSAGSAGSQCSQHSQSAVSSAADSSGAHIVEAFNVNDYGSNDVSCSKTNTAACIEKLAHCKLDSSKLAGCQNDERRERVVESGEVVNVMEVVVIHGGMDAGGEIFDDCLLMPLSSNTS